MPRPRTRKPAHLELAGLDPLGRPLEEWERALVEPILTRLFDGPKSSIRDTEEARDGEAR
jgi:hypothetical protein